MNLTELINNIDIVCKPMDNKKDLNPFQQHAKDTLHACRLMVHKLWQTIEEKDEHLSINYNAWLEQGFKLKKAEGKLAAMLVELEALKQENEDLRKQNELFKQNLTL